MKRVALFYAFSIVLVTGCARSPDFANKTPEPEPALQAAPDEAKPPIYVHISGMSSAQLCERLISIETMPTRDPNITDPIYESLIAKGSDAIPCLLEKISDATPMPDPRYSVPSWQHFAMGDTAVFILVDILRDNDADREKLLIEMLPPQYEKEWETNGIYAYFNYVSEPKNRKELQSWWRKWLKENETNNNEQYP